MTRRRREALTLAVGSSGPRPGRLCPQAQWLVMHFGRSGPPTPALPPSAGVEGGFVGESAHDLVSVGGQGSGCLREAVAFMQGGGHAEHHR